MKLQKMQQFRQTDFKPQLSGAVGFLLCNWMIHILTVINDAEVSRRESLLKESKKFGAA